MTVSALVVGGDRSAGLHPLALLGGRALVVHAVRALLDSAVADRVVVLDRADRADAVLAACSGLPVTVRAVTMRAVTVRAHAAQRADPGTGDAAPDVVVLHDISRPLAPPGLAVAVVEQVRRGAAAAVPTMPMPDTVKQVDGTGLVTASLDRETLRQLQTPVAVRRELLTGSITCPALPAVAMLARAGHPVATVPGDSRAFAVRTDRDLELAELLLAQQIDTGTMGG